MSISPKPSYTLDLVVIIHPAKIHPPTHPEAALWHPDPGVALITMPLDSVERESEARQAIDDERFAAVAIPHDTPDAFSILDCYCLNKRAHEILMPESFWLQTLISELIARYRSWCHPIEDSL
jgi:hypothetical protein